MQLVIVEGVVLNMFGCYVCYCRDVYIRSISTSGGIFGVVANDIIKEKGIVYGARFSNDFMVVHDRATQYETYSRFHGSKYLQSVKGNVFRQVKEDLKNKKKVLFTGTPCEVAGLHASLCDVDTSNLFCIDFICRGIPSPKLWKQYLTEQANIEDISNIQFKSKRTGWKNFSFMIQFKDGTERIEDGRKNIYFQSLFNGLVLRPSCYSCPFRNTSHASDFTIGDAWGVDSYFPDMIDDKGTSSLLVHSEKGVNMLDKIKNQLILIETTKDLLVQGNQSLIKQPSRPNCRNSVFRRSGRVAFEQNIHQCMRWCNIHNKLKSHLKRFLN